MSTSISETAYTELMERIAGFNEKSWAYMFHIEAPTMISRCNALDNPEQRFEALTLLSNGKWIGDRQLAKAHSFLSSDSYETKSLFKAASAVLESRCSPPLNTAFEAEYRRGFSNAWEDYPESKVEWTSILASPASTISDLDTKTGYMYTTGKQAWRSARSIPEFQSNGSDHTVPGPSGEDIAEGHHDMTRQLFQDVLQRNTTRERGPGFYGPTDIDTIRSILSQSISLMSSGALEPWVKITEAQKSELERWDGVSDEDKTAILREVGRYLHYRDKRNKDKERKRKDQETERAQAARSDPTV